MKSQNPAAPQFAKSTWAALLNSNKLCPVPLVAQPSFLGPRRRRYPPAPICANVRGQATQRDPCRTIRDRVSDLPLLCVSLIHQILDFCAGRRPSSDDHGVPPATPRPAGRTPVPAPAPDGPPGSEQDQLQALRRFSRPDSTPRRPASASCIVRRRTRPAGSAAYQRQGGTAGRLGESRLGPSPADPKPPCRNARILSPATSHRGPLL